MSKRKKRRGGGIQLPLSTGRPAPAGPLAARAEAAASAEDAAASPIPDPLDDPGPDEDAVARASAPDRAPELDPQPAVEAPSEPASTLEIAAAASVAVEDPATSPAAAEAPAPVAEPAVVRAALAPPPPESEPDARTTDVPPRLAEPARLEPGSADHAIHEPSSGEHATQDAASGEHAALEPPSGEHATAPAAPDPVAAPRRPLPRPPVSASAPGEEAQETSYARGAVRQRLMRFSSQVPIARASTTPPPPPRVPPPVRPPPTPMELAPGTEVTGELLRQLREQRGVSLKEIEETTRVRAASLAAVEAERFADLPDVKIYIRGFVQALARAIGLDPEAAANSYLTRWEHHRQRTPAPKRHFIK